MKKIYLILMTAFAVTFGACTDNGLVGDVIPEGPEAPVINSPDGANVGEIIVKFKQEVTTTLDQLATRAMGSVATRSGISSIDDVLDNIGTYKFERIFPVDNRKEELTRESGLHLWYVIHFDKAVDIEKVAQSLSKLNEVAKIEYSHCIKRAYDPADKPTYLTADALGKRAKTRAVASDEDFTDPYLDLQWGYINDGTILDGVKADNGDLVAQAVPGVDVGCKEAWQKCTGDPSIIVAVLDEGVMWDHADLQANMWENPEETFGARTDADNNGYNGDKYGYNFVNDMGFISYDDVNDTGHGTHVAGTIAAVNNNGIGVCGIAGGDGTPDSGVKIMSCQVFAGDAGSTLYQEAKAIKYAADNGAVVLQCSWGYNSGLANPLNYSPGYTDDKQWLTTCPLEKEALDYFIHNAGSPNGVIDGGIAVFAGGNEYAAMPGYPGAYSDYVSVAAVAADGTPSAYTNYGDAIDISAPGGDSEYHRSDLGKIYSTLPPLAVDRDKHESDGEKEGYGYMEGTSMACPHVSGVIALGLSYAAQQHRHFRAEDFRDLVYKSVSAKIEDYFIGETKTFWMNYSAAGSMSQMQMERSAYVGKMGSGLISAAELLNAIAGGAGVDMNTKVPNTFVLVNGTATVNYTRFFENGERLSFTGNVADKTVATMETTDGKTFVITGLKAGSTKATVTGGGKTKEFYITVRKNSSWM